SGGGPGMASGAEGSRTLDLLNAMRVRGVSHRAPACVIAHEIGGSTPANRTVTHGRVPSDRLRTAPGNALPWDAHQPLTYLRARPRCRRVLPLREGRVVLHGGAPELGTILV